MASLLRQLQAEWNSLVPSAQARGVRRVRTLSPDLLETIAYRKTKLEWLRAQIGTPGSFDSLTFGVELECILPRGYSHRQVAELVTQAGVDCRSEQYSHQNRTYWKIVTDGSLGNYTSGAELVSPVLRGEAGFDQLRKVCDVLTTIAAKINKRCGLHVHVGAESQPVQFFKNLVNLYSSAEDTIDSFVAPSRRASDNDFCCSLKSRVNQADLANARTIDQVAQSIRQTPGQHYVRDYTRYCKLNLKSFWQCGTVEFRQHQGTVDAAKAENWVRLVLRMCLTAAAGEKTVSTDEDLMTAVNCSDSERAYFLGRVNFFNNQLARRAAR